MSKCSVGYGKVRHCPKCYQETYPENQCICNKNLGWFDNIKEKVCNCPICDCCGKRHRRKPIPNTFYIHIRCPVHG